jgi:hypothetical protein
LNCVPIIGRICPLYWPPLVESDNGVPLISRYLMTVLPEKLSLMAMAGSPDPVKLFKQIFD